MRRRQCSDTQSRPPKRSLDDVKAATIARHVTNIEFFDLVGALRKQHIRPFLSLETSFEPLRNRSYRYVPFKAPNYMMFALKWRCSERDRITATMNSWEDYDLLNEYATTSDSSAAKCICLKMLNTFETWLITTTKSHPAFGQNASVMHNDIWEQWHVLIHNIMRQLSMLEEEKNYGEIELRLTRLLRNLLTRYRKSLLCRIDLGCETGGKPIGPERRRYFTWRVTNPLTFRYGRQSWRMFTDDTFWFEIAPMLLFDLPHWESQERVSSGFRYDSDHYHTRNSSRLVGTEDALLCVCDSALLTLIVISDRIIARYDRFTEIHWRQIEHLFHESKSRRLYVLLPPLSLAVARDRLESSIESTVDQSPPIYEHDYYSVNSLALDYIRGSRNLRVHHYDSVQCSCDYEFDQRRNVTPQVFNDEIATSTIDILTIRRMRETCVWLASLNAMSLRYSIDSLFENEMVDNEDDAIDAAVTRAKKTVPSMRDEALYRCYIEYGLRFVGSFVNTPTSTREQLRFSCTNVLFGYICLSLRIMYKSIRCSRRNIRINGRSIWYNYRHHEDHEFDAWLDGITLDLLSTSINGASVRPTA